MVVVHVNYSDWVEGGKDLAKVDNELKDMRLKIRKMELEYGNMVKEARYKLSLIEKGNLFGFSDVYGGIFPCKLREVVDRDDCIVRVYETSIRVESVVCVTELVVMGDDGKEIV